VRACHAYKRLLPDAQGVLNETFWVERRAPEDATVYRGPLHLGSPGWGTQGSAGPGSFVVPPKWFVRDNPGDCWMCPKFIKAAIRSHNANQTILAGTTQPLPMNTVDLDSGNLALASNVLTADTDGLYHVTSEGFWSWIGIGSFTVDIYSSVRGRLYGASIQSLVAGEQISVWVNVTGTIQLTFAANQWHLSMVKFADL